MFLLKAIPQGKNKYTMKRLIIQSINTLSEISLLLVFVFSLYLIFMSITLVSGTTNILLRISLKHWSV